MKQPNALRFKPKMAESASIFYRTLNLHSLSIAEIFFTHSFLRVREASTLTAITDANPMAESAATNA